MLVSNEPLTEAAPWWQPKPPSRLLVTGGQPLVGTYRISGAKNSVLPLMVAALLTPHRVTLQNAPASLDVAVLAALLRRLGARLEWRQDDAGLSVEIVAERIHAAHIDRDLVARMRASVLLLSALLVRCGEAGLPLPGGDAIGLRGIDFHVAGLEAMGAEVEISGSTIYAKAPSGLHGADFTLPFPSVGATENLMIAAVGASGVSIIRNAAREPEIDDLAHCLVAMGATITGIGTSTITIEGGAELRPTVHAIVPDRIEMGTLACAAALTDGELLLANARIELLGSAGEVFRRAGVDLQPVEGGVLARRAAGGLRATDVLTGPFPGFATDLQAPAMALLALATGTSVIEETIFEQRFRHAEELRRMGAQIEVDGRRARITGVSALSGASVAGTDVRAAAALVIAALAADGQSEIGGLDHLDRGYDGMAEKLRRCGADIVRVGEA
ncbi:MAG TPA: UDP-N-acetylglucosamine 1-carboxyvinyltransferase [Devosiaceae bacterium]|nr:UDP-N-acetylglucosamine 1-carboxyvinyltransferase [Devosiaceae bacterium]